LKRRKSSGVYYAFVKWRGKQFSRSFESKDKAFARHRVAGQLRNPA
jgi:hypothetical protein